MYRRLTLIALALAFVVVVVGAYVRLSNAGLGCPDWPGCYGHPVPTALSDSLAQAKAWKEMVHRYLAGTLGLLILLLAVLAWRRRSSPGLPSVMVAVVALQAALGMWTVTLLLKPAIVTAHLLGGMTTLSLLVWLFLRQGEHPAAPEARALRPYALAALAVVAVQITLGGWVSANYAALACPDLPWCLGRAVPPMDFRHAFHVFRNLGYTSEGQVLPAASLTAIHWTHRMFALVVVAVVGAAAARTFKVLPALGALLGALLVLQFSLGIANVYFGLPLAIADAHNAGAALLLSAVVMLNFFAFRGSRPFR